MIDAAKLPDVLTILRTAIAFVVFLFLPGHLFLKRDGVKIVESVFFSLLLLTLTGIALVFTVGLSETTIFASYAVMGALWWIKNRR